MGNRYGKLLASRMTPVRLELLGDRRAMKGSVARNRQERSQTVFAALRGAVGVVGAGGRRIVKAPARARALGVLGSAVLTRLNGVFSNYPDLESVTLFGSHALGSASRRSDIDLATRGIRDPHTLGRLVLDLDDLDLPQTCDVKALEAIRYPPLKRHIAEVGVTIYTRPAPHT